MWQWEVVMSLLCWELMWGCWLLSRVVTSMQSLHEHRRCLFRWSDFYFLLFIYDVHVEMAFVLTSTVMSFTFGYSNFQGKICIYVVRNMGRCANHNMLATLHLGVCKLWHENLWRCSTIKLFLSSALHKPSTHFLCEFEVVSKL